ncbi:hemolysin family protein [candidate division NPL-UPA2 bacterium]|nr:hemolysin family protein [candidate division NPL-UPA2 bacterium]
MLAGQLIGLVVLLLFSAYFSASETALTALGKLKMKSLMEKEKEKAPLLSLWAEDPNRLLTTILVGNNIANVAASILFTVILLRLLGPTATGRAAALSMGIMTFLILVFGEIAPKTYARQNAEGIALRTIGLLKFLSRVLSPLIKSLVFVANIIIRLSGGKIAKPGPFMTEEDIRGMLSVGEDEGVLEEEEREMIDSIFKFGDTKVQEVMVSRLDIVAVEAGRSLTDILKAAVEAGHSRIPVFEKKIDNIIGVLYVKDLLNLWRKKDEEKLKVRDLIRAPYFVPETKKVNELLREFQKKKIHLAIVVDEYGGTAGLVTLEDLLEEIVGEIEDEYDEEREEIKILEEGVALINGRMDIGEVNERLSINLPEKEGVETVAGFVVDYLGRVPQTGEELTYENLLISVVEAERRRVVKVRIAKSDKPPEGEQGEKNET